MFLRFRYTSNVDIRCNVVYGTDWFEERLNQYSVRTLDGLRTTYDVGPTIVKCNLVLKNVSVTGFNLLNEFITDQICFMRNKFTLTQLNTGYVPFPTGYGVDLGNGPGVVLEDCYFTKTDTEGVFTFTAPGLYEVKLPIEYRRAIT